MRTAAEKLNLKPHKLKEFSSGKLKTLAMPVDIEGHLGTDGRFYVVGNWIQSSVLPLSCALLDIARLFPPTTPQSKRRGCYLYRLMRPEFVRQYQLPLSSDAFSRFGMYDPESDLHNKYKTMPCTFFKPCW